MKLFSSRIGLLMLLMLNGSTYLQAAKQVISSQQQLSAAKSKGNVILKYTASWCPACQMVKEKFEQLVNKYPNIYMAEVDVTANPDLATNNGVEGLPTFVFYKNGSVVDRVVGAPDNFHAEMGQKIAQHFGSNGEKKKESNNAAQDEQAINISQENKQITTEPTPMQNMPEPVSSEGILGQIGGLFAGIFNTIKEIIIGIIDWFRRLLGL